MPLDKTIRKVLIVGSGPIVIGQAAEFDYAGAQACRALRAEGLEVVLVNPNPATIMTDREMADEIYLEPLTLPFLKRVIEKERPDSLLSTLGGQTGLNLSMQLAKEGFLESHGVRLLGAGPETIDRAEDRRLFKETMERIGQPVIPSGIAETLEDSERIAEEIGYPVIVRPAFTLGGSGGGIARDREQLREIARGGLYRSPIHQVLIEKCVAGWKEIEFEVMRDRIGNAITVCSMENLDPVGVHTGDSIVAAPALTLADKEYQMLRTAALDIISSMGLTGGCNCQFALNPDSFEYAVIEVNPRVSRSSALASKATGYPIAKVAARLAVGYTLDEIPNAVTGTTSACFEPALDYVVVKFPKWPFDKFVYAKRTLGTQMKATGEVMAIAPGFEAALMKAVRGAEVGLQTLRDPLLGGLPTETIRERLGEIDDRRLFVVYEALRRGIPVDEIHQVTKIDRWFLSKIRNLAEMELRLESGSLDAETYREARRMGFPDPVIEKLAGTLPGPPLRPAYRMVDTCAAEFQAETPYFYADPGARDEAQEYLRERPSGKKRVLVLGSGPIRIGQGIEFDYCSVQCVRALKAAGYETAIINNNPETVSTDFDTADRLYFEPLTISDVLDVIQVEQPWAVVAAFGGGTAIKLAGALADHGIPLLGTTADTIDRAEDRERFDALLAELKIPRPRGEAVMTAEGALEAAKDLGYPVLLRPSYVLGGQNMIIAWNDGDIREYMAIILERGIDSPVLVDQYLPGVELEVDALCDGEDVLIPGIMEHIERAGVHSGDSIAVYPAWNIDGALTEKVIDCTKRLSLALGAVGMINIQYVAHHGELYVIEVNPRSSRTVPFLSKVTGVPMVPLAVRLMLGEKLRDAGYGAGLYRTPPYFAVKVPVFSFEKLAGADIQLGPEMKSTGEVLGLGKTFDEAIYKGLCAAGYRMDHGGGVLLTVQDTDKAEIADTARQFHALGFALYATEGTAKVVSRAGLPVEVIGKIHESEDNPLTLMESGKVRYIVSTSAKGRIPSHDDVKIRRRAVELSIPCLTSIDTANALATSLLSRYSPQNVELVDLNHRRSERLKLHFIKMQGSGNDYIYFDCFEQTVPAPESLSVALSERHYGIGSDGIVLIEPPGEPARADARMRMVNRDGSEGRMSGNALRCVGKYLYESGRVAKSNLSVETAEGIRRMRLYVQNGKVDSVRVDMGNALLDPRAVPVALEGERIVGRQASFGGKTYEITCVSMGNPHCVIFCDELDTVDLTREGAAIESDPLFPERTNVEFVQVVSAGALKMKVWERGNGATLACGTGACASAVAAVLRGACQKNRDITVRMPGGVLTARYTEEGRVFLTGEAKKTFEGTVEI